MNVHFEEMLQALRPESITAPFSDSGEMFGPIAAFSFANAAALPPHSKVWLRRKGSESEGRALK
ncbi:MAG: hypothetical protein ACFE0O_08695 [Opitutales bacterium]